MAMVTTASRKLIKGRTLKVLHAYPHGIYTEDVETHERFVFSAMQGILDEPWLVVEPVDDTNNT